jgi:flagellar hook-basal body complex protein FliE
VLNPIQSPGIVAVPDLASPAPAAPAAGGFQRVLGSLLSGAAAQDAAADQAVRSLAMGQTDNVHGVLLDVAKADLCFRMVLEIRNRLTDAYQEVMRMQI